MRVFLRLSGLVIRTGSPKGRAMAFRNCLNLAQFLTAPAFLFLFFLISGDAYKIDRAILPSAISVQVREISLDPSMIAFAPGLPLKVTGAWHLTSANRDFGGLSALHASGSSLTFVSDNGALIRLGIDPSSRTWRGTIASMPVACGTSAADGQNDSEALASDERTGTLWIGFEARNAICRIADTANGGSVAVAPPSMQDWAATSGPEALVRRRDGSFLVFQEKRKRGRDAPELLAFARDPALLSSKPVVMFYRPPTGFLPVDATELPDRRLLVLSRRFALPFNFTNRISIVTVGAIESGRTLTGPIIARITDPRIADNYEAISVDRLDDRYIIWLATDDNYTRAQRTILLRLEWQLTR
jgi:hypothetical protein